MKKITLILFGLVIIGAGMYFYLKYIESRGNTVAITTSQNTNSGVLSEVDFGFVELNPGQPMPISSYKHGGNMVLYAGEELRFQSLADGEIPVIELRVGDSVQLLSGSEGKLKIVGPMNQPLTAVLLAKGSRVSLPGGAPPRLAVKLQVFGATRQK